MLHNTTERWGTLQQLLHWGVVALVLMQLLVGMTLARTPPENPAWQSLMPFHASIGIGILITMLVRLVWRLRNPVPELPDTLTPREKQLAHMTHWLLYVTLISIPIVGWLTINAFGQSPTVLGFDLPALIAADRELGAELKTWHSAGVAVLGALLTLHIGAALRHGYVLKDGVLNRMAPFMERAHSHLPVGQQRENAEQPPHLAERGTRPHAQHARHERHEQQGQPG
jgi:cytochrome b561